MKAILTMMTTLALVAFAAAQGTGLTDDQKRAMEEQMRRQDIRASELLGINVELAAIGGFRGARANTVMGYGLVVGLNGTGDTKSVQATSTAMSNALSRWGTLVSPASFNSKNIAIVSVTCEIPAFAAPGRTLDISVQSLGDAKSLEGGFLLPTPLGPAWDATKTFATATGALSLGGFNVGASGSSVRKNHPTSARVPNGGTIENSVPTEFVFDGGTIYFDLDTPDFTTARRVAEKINEVYPDFFAKAEDGATIKIGLPNTNDAVTAISRIEKLEVYANTPPTVVINERTGTIVVGGNVKLGPAIIAHGSLRVQIDTQNTVSQPLPFSQGQTTEVQNSVVNADEDPPQVTVVAPNASLDDLARIFQTLNLSARDIIAILQALADQGALKARIRIQ